MKTIMEIKYTMVEGVMLFEFFGELDDTNEDKIFHEVYEIIGDYTNKRVVFDFKGLHFMNSKSIGYIADVFTNLEHNNGVMSICSVMKSIYDVFEIVGVNTIIPIVNTREDAMKIVLEHNK